MLPLDLHVLSLSLAFILSQDQTLHCQKVLCLRNKEANQNPLARYSLSRLVVHHKDYNQVIFDVDLFYNVPCTTCLFHHKLWCPCLNICLWTLFHKPPFQRLVLQRYKRFFIRPNIQETFFRHSHLSTPFLNCECKDRKNFSIHQISAPNLRETESSTSKTLGAKNRPPPSPHWATKRSHFSFAVAKIETIFHSTKYIHQENRI